MRPEDEFDAILDTFGMLRDRQWIAAALSALVWLIIVIAFILIAPFALGGAIWTGSKKILLKFRRLSLIHI